MEKLDLSRLNVFLDFIQNTHQYTELGWVHEATDAMYKKVSKLFDTFRESFAGLTVMEDVIKTDIPTPVPVADSVVRKVLREKSIGMMQCSRNCTAGTFRVRNIGHL